MLLDNNLTGSAVGIFHDVDTSLGMLQQLSCEVVAGDHSFGLVGVGVQLLHPGLYAAFDILGADADHVEADGRSFARVDIETKTCVAAVVADGISGPGAFVILLRGSRRDSSPSRCRQH